MKKTGFYLGTICLVSWSTLVVVWLSDVGGDGVPAAVAKVAIVTAGLATLVATSYLLWRVWRGPDDGRSARAGRVLLVLVVLSIVSSLIGIDWEVSGRYYRDEGIYYAAAQDLNEGRLLPESFIYGHLPYYIYAVALWIQSMFPQQIGWITGMIYGSHKEVEVSWLILRAINSTLGALTTIPVFVIGFRIAGLFAGSLGALLIIFSPIYTEISRLIISDVPSAFFATLSLMFVAFLLDRERWPPYLLAGAAAGLAAASKYPAGVVVVAIIGIWIYWRVRKRNWSWSLAVAGLVSLATFLAVMPALWAHSGNVFVGQGKDMLFGLRQYGRGGWIGVMPGSNAGWYAKQLLVSFGLPAIFLGVSAWPWLDRRSRRRYLQMLPYPLTFLILLASMSMVVKRNLLPVLPAVAAMLGVGAIGWAKLAERRLSSRPMAIRRVVPCALAVVVLAIPAVRTTMQTIAFSRPSTRDQAASWIQGNVPRGARFIQESYTPHLHFKKHPTRKSRFAARIPLEEIRNPEWDFLLLAQNAYGRFMDPDNWAKPHHELYAQRYEEMLKFELAQDFPPSKLRQGPYVRLFKIDPKNLVYRTAKRFDFEAQPYRFPKEGAFLLLKEYFQKGDYELRADTIPSEASGRIRIVTRGNRPVGEISMQAGLSGAKLEWDDKYFMYLYYPKETQIRWFELERVGPGE